VTYDQKIIVGFGGNETIWGKGSFLVSLSTSGKKALSEGREGPHRRLAARSRGKLPRVETALTLSASRAQMQWTNSRPEVRETKRICGCRRAEKKEKDCHNDVKSVRKGGTNRPAFREDYEKGAGTGKGKKIAARSPVGVTKTSKTISSTKMCEHLQEGVIKPRENLYFDIIWRRMNSKGKKSFYRERKGDESFRSRINGGIAGEVSLPFPMLWEVWEEIF